MAEEVSESHDGVLSVLDQVGLGSVSNVLRGVSMGDYWRDEEVFANHLLAGIGDGAGDLPLTILVGDTQRVTLLVDDSDRGVRLAKVDTKDGRTSPGG